MSETIQQAMIRFRGALPQEGPGARGFAAMARNPDCLRAQAIYMAGSSPARALETAYGDQETRQSPFALTIGNQLDAAVTRIGGALLLPLFRGAGRLRVEECKVVDLAELIPDNGDTNVMRARRRRMVERFLQQKLARDPDAPNIILKPTLAVSFLGQIRYIEPDLLVASDADRFYRPGEIKSYADRGAKTRASKIRSAAGQAAISVVALRQFLTDRGAPAPERSVPPIADLIFRRPRTLSPTLNPHPLDSEVEILSRILAQAEQQANELGAFGLI